MRQALLCGKRRIVSCRRAQTWPRSCRFSVHESGRDCVCGHCRICAHYSSRPASAPSAGARALSFERLWELVRKEVPTPIDRLRLYGELLRIIGDTLLSEHNRGRQLEQTLANLEKANRTKDEFLATLSHELRPPLNTILGWSKMLRAGTLDAAMTARALETSNVIPGYRRGSSAIFSMSHE